VSMMAAGEISAAFTGNAGIGREGPPQAGWEAKGRPKTTTYRELLPEGRQLGADWYRHTGIYPFHSIMVIKDDVLKAHPWLARSLYDVFSEAKMRWLPALKSGQAPSAEDQSYRDLMPLVGDDPLPYGIEANRKSIDALITYSVQQGLMPRPLPVEQLFADPKV
jgi:4,5-dihydroxyphthalate decarboxylase